jgi:hypothetical protein
MLDGLFFWFNIVMVVYIYEIISSPFCVMEW